MAPVRGFGMLQEYPKLEAGLRRVPDGEVFFVAKVLMARTDELFPKTLNSDAGQVFRRRLGKDGRAQPSH